MYILDFGEIVEMLTKTERLHKFRKKVRHRIFSKVESSVPVFVGGEQRSGTNFLTEVLNRCVETNCFLENDDEAFDNYMLRDLERIKSLTSASRAKITVFKSISDSQNISTIFKILPNAKIIWAFRQYPDVVNSSVRNFTEHRKYLYYMLHEPTIARWRLQNVTDEDLALVRYHYDRGVDDASSRALIWYLRNSLFFQQGLDKRPNVIITKYEELVTKPAEQFEKVYRFLGLQSDRQASEIASTGSLNKNPPPVIDDDITELCNSVYARLDACYQQQS